MDTTRSLAVFFCVVSAALAFPGRFFGKGFGPAPFVGGLGLKPAFLPNIIPKPNILPAPIITRPAPIITRPAPIISQPAPIISQPAQVISQPAQVIAQPAPVISPPAQVITQPAQVIAQPAQVISQPAQVVAQPVPVISQAPQRIFIQNADQDRPAIVQAGAGLTAANVVPIAGGGAVGGLDGRTIIPVGSGGGAAVVGGAVAGRVQTVPVVSGRPTLIVNRGPTINGGIEADRVTVTNGGLVVRSGGRGLVKVVGKVVPSVSASRRVAVVSTCEDCD